MPQISDDHFLFFIDLSPVVFINLLFFLHSEPGGDVKDLSAEDDEHKSVASSEAATSESQCELLAIYYAVASVLGMFNIKGCVFPQL